MLLDPVASDLPEFGLIIARADAALHRIAERLAFVSAAGDARRLVRDLAADTVRLSRDAS
jgi:hypothetical protein